MNTHFDSFGLRHELLQAVLEAGYQQPTPIQVGAIPALLEGRDVVGEAQTGTGKTAAFALPMLQMMEDSARGVQALILTPTRELAGQVATSIHKYGKYRDVRVLPIYGGQSYDRQQRRLEKDIQVIVGTPGRTLDLINRRVLDLSTVRYVVLDEADEMLKMGFIEDVEAILQTVPTERQTALFSATISPSVRGLAQKYMHQPLSVTMERKQLTVPETEQRYYLVNEQSKLAALARLLETENMKSALIFTRTRTGSAELAEALLERGYLADALHGELNQAAREAVLRRFRNGQLPVLVATDVVARGVDIPEVSHVFNYDMPYDPEDYVHRIGRTGRAGRSGTAITLVTPRERRRLSELERFTRQSIPRAELPKLETVRAAREQRFVHELETLLASDSLEAEIALVEQLVEAGFGLAQVTAAAIRMARADEARRPAEHIKAPREDAAPKARANGNAKAAQGPRQQKKGGQEPGMVRLQMNVGRNQGIRPADIVGTIATEAGIPGKAIGAIDIQRDRTYVDVKDSHVERVLKQMGRGHLRGKPITLTRAG